MRTKSQLEFGERVLDPILEIADFVIAKEEVLGKRYAQAGSQDNGS